tara:strand:+ start:289 stop:849 length:561 start_codon:yes stop_codon:yes gene_type:complete
MSANYFRSDTNQENQTIKVNDAIIRGNCTVAGATTIAGTLGCTGDFTAGGKVIATGSVQGSQFIQAGPAATFVQATSLSTEVDASGAAAGTRQFQIETVNATLAFGASALFNLILPTGSLGTSPSYHNVMFSIYDYSGSYATNGTPFAYVAAIDPTQHRLRIVVKNIAASQPLSGVLKFNINIVGA